MILQHRSAPVAQAFPTLRILSLVANLRFTDHAAMCGFCTLFSGIPHWTETGTEPDGPSPASSGPAERAARAHRVRLVNRIARFYGCQVDDWMGDSYVVRSQRGHVELVGDLPLVWETIARLAAQPLDPLAPGLLATLGPESTR